MKKIRRKIEIRGIVQGVGFRPAVYRLAKKHNIKGIIFNNTKGVVLDLEASSEELNAFLKDLRRNPPPLSRIDSVSFEELPLKKYLDFEIIESKEEEEKITLVSPDIAICNDCEREILDPKDRRYLYPFINCTNCGPRFTITKSLPYDRKNTTMNKFKMCERCEEEYNDPEDRRFHAQPNACGDCGPSLKLLMSNGEEIKEDPISKTIELLREGKIVAIKGLGGFHLACNAKDKKAIKILRERKRRPYKPFALMAKDICIIEKFAFVSNIEKELLESPEAPIVLLKKKENSLLPEEIAPLNNFLGFMLPYTPLHFILFQKSPLMEVLVMTSGNKEDEPIAFDNEEAIKRLRDIADYFLIHNRDIWIQVDDSICKVIEKEPLIIRRSRGYAPAPIKSPFESKKRIIGFGAHKHNTFSISRGDEIFISHYVGETDNVETIKAFERGINHFIDFFDLQPDVAVVDLHPNYEATKFGRKWAEENKKPIIEVQHHHAHIASCLLDNKVQEKVIGIAWDGTGYGTDGKIWGGEFLIADFTSYERRAHLKYIPLPGGEFAIKEPWRMGVTYLYKTFGDDFFNLNIEFVKKLDREKCRFIKKMIDRKLNTPETSSIGRLFDAVSAIIGIRDFITYQGQAAIELEMIANEEEENEYAINIEKEGNFYIIDPLPIIRGIVEDIIRKISPNLISSRFHQSLVKMILKVSILLREETGINKVCLSGGVFQNTVLRGRVTKELKREGFEVFNHREIPPNDGGISSGQAIIGMKLFS
ncbi:MAG: carbamoyltransferase HypF [candidate division WOR-3 bacterium]